MRLLGCFSKNRIVLDAPALSSDPPSPASPSSPATQTFVPASIAELHPEYAHAEPYCFTARTESARVLLDKVTAKKGLKVDRAATLKEQGQVVVRGPAHSARFIGNESARNNQEPENRPTTKDVVLTVESPTTEGASFVESDDQDENINIDNKQRKLKKSKSNGKRSGGIAHRSGKGSSGRISNVSVRRKSNASVGRKPQTERKRKSDLSTGKDSSSVLKISDKSVPRPIVQRTYSSSVEDIAIRVEGRTTPPELLAPIVVPRMSHAFNGSVSESPAISNDSWVGDSEERFEDIEEDTSSALKWSAVGKEKVIHKVDVARAAETHSDFLLTGSPALNPGIRSKRKSKPFLHAQANMDDSTVPEAPDSSYSHLRLAPMLADADTVARTMLARQISAGSMSEDIQVVDTSEDLCRIPSPARKHATGQRNQHEGLMYLPKASPAGKTPPGIMRRPSNTNKRKTVSFHDESPIVIEPNLRAPSRSLPRNVMFSKSSSESGEFQDAFGAPQELTNSFCARDSFSIPSAQPRSNSSALYSPSKSSRAEDPASLGIDGGVSKLPAPANSAPLQSKLATATIPRTLDIPRSRMYREYSDSSGTEDSFHLHSSRRITRVSSKDKIAIREASKRQSQAVAKALSEQIRGVPKSAMLAYEENDVIISDDGGDFDDEDSDFSFRRKSRQSKVIRAPVVVPGEVPPPPPPPPFVPEVPRIRSVRRPPPPPVSPLSRSHEQ